MSTDWGLPKKRSTLNEGKNSLLNQADTLNSEAEQVRQVFYQLKSNSSNNESMEELESARQELRKTRDEIAALKQSQSFIIASSSDAVITTDRDLNITGWNQAAEDLLGWQAEDILAGNTSEQARTAILQVLTEEVINSLTEKSIWTGDAITRTRDNRQLKTRISIGIIWDNSGEFNGVTIIYHPDNISKPSDAEFEKRLLKEHTDELIKANRVLQQELVIYKKAALLAKESEGKNRDLVDNIKLGIFRCTPGSRGRFLEINRAMEDITGYSREELLQKEVCSLYANNSGDNAFTNEVNVTDWKETRELILKRKDGSEITVASQCGRYQI